MRGRGSLFLVFRERKLLILGHIPHRRMQRLEFPNELDSRRFGIIVVELKLVNLGVMIYFRRYVYT